MKKRNYFLLAMAASALMLSACSSSSHESTKAETNFEQRSEEDTTINQTAQKDEDAETTAVPGETVAVPGIQVDESTEPSTEDISIVHPVTGSNSIYDGLEGWEILKKCYEYTDETCNHVKIEQIPSERAIETHKEFQPFTSRRFRIGDNYYRFYNTKDLDYDGDFNCYQFKIEITNHEAMTDSHYLSLKNANSTNYTYIYREIPADSSANQPGEHYLLGHHWYDYQTESSYTTTIDGDTIILESSGHTYYIKDGFMVKEEYCETMDGEYGLARTLIYSDYGTVSEEYPTRLFLTLKQKDYLPKEDMYTFAEYMGLEFAD